MFCGTCGNQMPDDAKFCTACGRSTAGQAPEQPYPQQPYQQQPYGQPQQPYGQQPYPQPYQPQPYYQPPPPPPDVPSTGLNVLCFFFWIVGVVIYATSHQTTPLKAKAALKWSLIGLAFWVAFGILLGIVLPLLLMNSFM